MGDMRTFLRGHREIIVDPRKEVFEEADDVVGTQELICGASNYQEILGGIILEVVKSMVYEMLEET